MVHEILLSYYVLWLYPLTYSERSSSSYAWEIWSPKFHYPAPRWQIWGRTAPEQNKFPVVLHMECSWAKYHSQYSHSAWTHRSDLQPKSHSSSWYGHFIVALKAFQNLLPPCFCPETKTCNFMTS